MADTVLDVLKQAKANIAKFENWSPQDGGSSEKNTHCAYTTIERQKREHWLENGAVVILKKACVFIHGHSKIALLNDGEAPESIGKTPEERFKMIHEIYDKAIELAAEESK